MKKLVLTIFLITIFWSIQSFAENDLYFDPDSIHVQPGETVEVKVMLSDMDSVRAVAVDIAFDPDILEYQYLSEGDFFEPPILLMGAVMFGNYVNIAATMSDISQPCVSGSGHLFTIVFEAKTDGSSELSIAPYTEEPGVPTSYWQCQEDNPQPFGSLGISQIHVGATDVEGESWGKIKRSFGE